MSTWHRPQVSLVRKKSAGMVPPVFVVADDGANGLDAPAPSSAMVAGGRTGFSMRWVSRHSASRAARRRGALRPAAAAATRPMRTARVHPGVHSMARHRCTPHRTAPATDTVTWICSNQAWSRVAPTAATASPRASPAARSPTPAAAGTLFPHGRRHASRTSAPTSTRPSRGCRPTLAKYARDADGAATRWTAVSSRAMKPNAASRDVLIVSHRNAGLPLPPWLVAPCRGKTPMPPTVAPGRRGVRRDGRCFPVTTWRQAPGRTSPRDGDRHEVANCTRMHPPFCRFCAWDACGKAIGRHLPWRAADSGHGGMRRWPATGSSLIPRTAAATGGWSCCDGCFSSARRVASVAGRAAGRVWSRW